MKDASPPLDVKQPSVPAYWIIGVFIFLNTMICYFDRVNFSVAAPAIMKHFNWDIGIIGLVMPMFGWTSAIGVGSVLALLSAIIMYLTAPKAIPEDDPALSKP